LVEVDLHAGLMDSIELEWRGHVMVQRLDYLGLPFRCTTCRRTRHLRKDCLISMVTSEEEDDQMSGSKDMFYIEECLEEHISMGGGETVGMDELSGSASQIPSLVRFKFIVHIFSLSYHCGKGITWKILYYYIQVSSVVNKKVVVSLEKGGALGVPDNNLPLPSSVSVVSETSVPLVSSPVDLNSLAIPSPIFTRFGSAIG
jgi:hypothetical protein